MPENDLGTAHGKVKITVDDRQLALLATRMAAMERIMQKTNRNLNKVAKELGKLEKATSDSERGFDRATKATGRFNSGLLGTRQGFKSFHRDATELISDLRTVYRVVDQGKKHFTTLSRTIRVLNTAGQYSAANRSLMNQAKIVRALTISMAQLGEQTNATARNFANGQRFITRNLLRNENALLGIRSATTLAGTAYLALRNKIFGVNAAIDKAPGWVKKMTLFTSSLMKVSGAMAVVGYALGPFKIIEKFARSGALTAITKSAHGMASAFERVGSVQQRVFGRDYTRGFVAKLRNADETVSRFFDRTSVSSIRLGESIRNASTRLFRFANDSKSLLGGIALLTNGIGALWHRFQWFFKLPKTLMAGLAVFFSRVMPTALHALGSALRGTSNLFVGLWDGIKQLSGALTILPGLISTVVAGVSSLAAVFIGLGDKFKDVFSSDPDKALEAYMLLPEHLKPIADSIKKIIPQWKKLQVALQSVAFVDAGKQIDELNSNYFPIFEKGATRVVSAVRKMKDEFVGFLLQGQTKTDTSSIYRNTADSILQIAKATQPAAAGLRDMSVIGTNFIRSMSSFMPVLAQKFQQWADVNRQNGNFMKWMEDSVHGAYDLVKGLGSLTKAAWTVLTIFKSNNGENFLDRFAKAMERLNKAATESSIDGTLARIRLAAQNMGADKIDEFKEIMHLLSDAIKGIIPFISNLSNAFSDVFVGATERAVWVLSNFMELLNELSITPFLGWVLGIFGAFKLLPKIFGTAIDAVKTFGGAILIMNNREKVVRALETAFLALGARMETMGTLGQRVGNGLMNVTNAASGAIGIVGRLATAFTLVGIAALSFFALYNSSEDDAAKLNKQLDDNKKHLTDFKKSLRNAFVDDGTIVGHSVMGAVETGLNQMMQDLQATADSAPGLGAQIWDALTRNIGNTDLNDQLNPFQQSDAINQAQAIASGASDAAKKFQELRDKGVDLNAVLVANDTEFKKFIDNLRTQGSEGNNAADALEKQRAAFKGIEADMRRIGPAGVELSEGIKKIAEAGGDATSKLEGLKKILEALGIIKTSALQAAADYEQGLADLSSKVSDLVEQSGALDRSKLMNGDTFNVATQEGRDFLGVMSSLGEEFLASVSAGANADTEYAKFEARLKAISEQTGISIDDLKKLATQVGLVPKGTFDVSVPLKLSGAAPAEQELYEAFIKMQQMVAGGVQVSVEIPSSDAESLKKRINELLGKDAVDVDGTNLRIKPGISASDLQRVMAELAAKGISMPGNTIPVTPSQVPLKPGDTVPTKGNGPHGGDPITQVQQDPSNSASQVIDNLKEQLQGAADSAHASGNAFTTDFAAGILEKKSEVERAAEAVAQAARDRMPGSPAKKGPLSGSGWSGVAGKSFSSDFAWGITTNVGQVSKASDAVAGAAAGALSFGGAGQAGEFLGQLTRLNNFGAHLAEVIGKVAENVLGFAKFFSDPMGKGTFFGKSLGFKRDPSVTPEILARRNADAAQARASAFAASGSRDLSAFDTTTGMPKITGPGALQRNSSKSDIIAAMVAKGQEAGLNKEQIAAMVATAWNETGGKFDPLANGGIQGGNGTEADRVLGLFQEKAHFGTVEQRTDPNQAIDRFIVRFKASLANNSDPITAATLAQNPQLGSSAPDSAYENVTKKYLGDAIKAINEALASGATTPMTGDMAIPGIGATGGLPRPSILQDTGSVPSQPLSVQAAAIIAQLFPQIPRIGGSRDTGTAPNTHDTGTSIDIMIPNGTTANGANPAGKKLGDQINDFLKANADALGIKYTIWQDLGQMSNGGATFNQPGHMDHIDVHFADGGKATIGPNGTKLVVPYGSSGVIPSDAFGPPVDPNQPPSPPKNLVVQNPDGTFSPVTPHGESNGAPPAPLNPATGQPWTPEEAAKFFAQYPLQYDQNQLQNGDLQVPGVVAKTQDQMLAELQQQTPMLQTALAVGPNSTDEQIAASLSAIQAEIDRQNALDTPSSRQIAAGLESKKSDIMSSTGFTQESNPIDTAMNIAGSLTSVAGDVFKVIDSSIQAVGATKAIADLGVRGMSNTEDIYNTVDQVQKFITLFADIAGATSSITSAIGSIVGAAGGSDPSGGASAAATAIQGVSQIAGLIQSTYETINAVIDLGQEAYRIVGSYVGDFLGFLVGGSGGKLEGNVRFLLDQVTGQLQSYSQDNPLDKRTTGLPFAGQTDTSARDQKIGSINMYGGYGSDPRDLTRQMMFQVKAAQFAGAFD